MIENNKFAPPHPLNTAVLFLVFNRLDTTKQVFEAIKEAKPPRLYIAADGARADKDGEDKKAQDVREFIMSNIDWNCEVKTLFREKNLGCKYAVSGAIDWFFENEEMGIILEDDCLPSRSFFWFCEELLLKYKDNMRVGEISGNNFQKGIQRGDGDYYFSIYSHIWGWATWKDRWKNYDIELDSIDNSTFINNMSLPKSTKIYWIKIFNKMKEKKIDTWDYQWTFTLWINNQLTVLPNINLVENVGFGEDATHTTGGSEFANLKAYQLKIQYHPDDVSANKEADIFTSKLMFNIGILFKNKLLHKFMKIIPKQNKF